LNPVFSSESFASTSFWIESRVLMNNHRTVSGCCRFVVAGIHG
jgi:hypothetical protein